MVCVLILTIWMAHVRGMSTVSVRQVAYDAVFFFDLLFLMGISAYGLGDGHK